MDDILNEPGMREYNKTNDIALNMKSIVVDILQESDPEKRRLLYNDYFELHNNLMDQIQKCRQEALDNCISEVENI